MPNSISKKKKKKRKSIPKGWFRNNRRPHRCVATAASFRRRSGMGRDEEGAQSNAGPEQMGVVEVEEERQRDWVSFAVAAIHRSRTGHPLSAACAHHDGRAAFHSSIYIPRIYPPPCLYIHTYKRARFTFSLSLCLPLFVYISASKYTRVYTRVIYTRV